MPIGCDADNRELASAQPLSERTHLQAGGYPIQTGANNVLFLGLVEQLVIHAWIDRDVLISRTQVTINWRDAGTDVSTSSSPCSNNVGREISLARPRTALASSNRDTTVRAGMFS